MTLYAKLALTTTLHALAGYFKVMSDYRLSNCHLQSLHLHIPSTIYRDKTSATCSGPHPPSSAITCGWEQKFPGTRDSVLSCTATSSPEEQLPALLPTLKDSSQDHTSCSRLRSCTMQDHKCSEPRLPILLENEVTGTRERL